VGGRSAGLGVDGEGGVHAAQEHAGEGAGAVFEREGRAGPHRFPEGPHLREAGVRIGEGPLLGRRSPLDPGGPSHGACRRHGHSQDPGRARQVQGRGRLGGKPGVTQDPEWRSGKAEEVGAQEFHFGFGRSLPESGALQPP